MAGARRSKYSTASINFPSMAKLARRGSEPHRVYRSLIVLYH